MKTLDKLIDWFLHSQIFDSKAYLEYYSSIKKGPQYPEITGYATSLACILYERTRDRAFLDRAEECAKFMKHIARTGGIPCLRDNLLYTFDTGMYASSLFDLYLVTKKQLYLREAEKCLRWLYSFWDGMQFAAVDKIPKKEDWYHVPSVHLAKLIIPLMKAATCFEEKKYLKTALELFSKYKSLQKEDGGFRINENSSAIMVHPHCYAAEGFLYAYCTTRRREFLEAAGKSSDWLCRNQNLDGSFYTWYNAENEPQYRRKQESIKASDSTAQATRIWKLLGVNRQGIKKAYRYLDSELKDNGLRLYKTVATRTRVYSWPTFFYLHSLMLPFGKMEYCREIF